MGAVVGIALLDVLVGLLLLPLLALLFGLTVLPRAARSAYDTAGKTTDGQPFPGTFLAAGNAADNRTTDGTDCPTFQRAAAHAFLLLGRRRGAGGRHLHGIEAGLPLGPGITLELVFFQLILALTLGRINDGLLSDRGAPTED